MSHFVCPGGVRGKVEGGRYGKVRDCIVPSWIWIDEVIFFWIGYGFFSGPTMQLFVDR